MRFDTDRRLDRIEMLYLTLSRKVRKMSQEVDALKAADAKLDAAVQAAVTMIQGLAAQIAALPADAGAIAALATDVQAQADALSAAVATATPTPAPAAPTA